MVWLMLGCSPIFQNITQDPGAIGTVVTVSWWSSEEAEGRVVYGTSDGIRFMPATQQPADGGFVYEATVLGLTSDTKHNAVLQLHDGDGVLLEEETLDIHAGRLDMVLPPVSLTTLTARPEGYLLTTFLHEPSAVVILNGQGELIWAVEGRSGSVISEVRLHPAGGELLYGEYGLGDGEDSDNQHQIVRVSLDGSQQVRQHTPGLHHDFTVLPDGTVAYISYDPAEVDGQTVEGDRIVELSEDGDLVEIWSAWDALPFTLDTPSSSNGWTHANALNYDSNEDAYYLSLHNYNAILKIDRATGQTLWTLGGPHDDFGLPEEITFRRQHQFQVLEDDRILIFDNGSVGEGYSEVHELQLDVEARTVEAIWNYQPTDSVYTMIFGDVERLADGDTLITFCGSGMVEQVSTMGEVRWRMEIPMGSGLGYSKRLDTPAAFFAPLDDQ